MGYKKKSIEMHKKYRGKIEIQSKLPLLSEEELTLAYTPGVAGPCLEVYKHPECAKDYISTKNMVAIVTDGTAVLGLGDIGAVAGLPVMEGKAVLFKEFADIDAFPIALDTVDVDEIVSTIKHIAITFGGINLEDISAPRCFEIEERLNRDLNIPVFHDDQHGTAIVVLAGLINALKVVNKKIESIRVVVHGSGAAGIAIVRLLTLAGVSNIFLVDSHGVVSDCRDDLTAPKQEMIECCVVHNLCGALDDVLVGADVFIGVSKGGILTSLDIKKMTKDAIVFALANPEPEIMPDEAKDGGALIVATGRSDFPNQINNALVFPGIFRGALDNNVIDINDEIQLRVAYALASLIKKPTKDKIIPKLFDRKVVKAVADAVKN